MSQGVFSPLKNASSRLRKATTFHELTAISDLKSPIEFARIDDRQESCNELCGFLTERSVAERVTEAGRIPINIWEGHCLQLLDWSLRGCMFSKQLSSCHAGTTDLRLVRIVITGVRDYWTKINWAFDLLVEGIGHPFSKTFRINMLTQPDDPAAGRLKGRVCDENPVSLSNLTLVSEWLDRCANREGEHQDCPQWEDKLRKLPTRAISVLPIDQMPRLIALPGTGNIRYAALSYCWGGPQQHQTTEENNIQYQEALPLHELPRTIVDAILLTRNLGLPYLWIDSLCIIQDSEEDRIREIANMANIYKNAWVTYSAARALSCNQGFLQPQSVQGISTSFASLPIMGANKAIGTTSLHLTPSWAMPLDDRSSPILDRAWTHQEFLLSPRVVRYLDSGIEFCCTAGTQSHNGLQGLSNQRIGPLSRNPRLSSNFYDGKKYESKELRSAWFHIVEQYSSAQMTFGDDKLPALAGVAAEFQRITRNKYLAGMWEGTLSDDLLWRSRSPAGGRSSSLVRRKFRIPSWSWASVDGAKDMFWSTVMSIKSQVSIESISVKLVENRLPFGMVDGGCLTIRGYLQKLAVRKGRRVDFDFGSDSRSKLYPDYHWWFFNPEFLSTPQLIYFLSINEGWKHGFRDDHGLVLRRVYGENYYERIGVYQVDKLHYTQWVEQFEEETVNLI